MATQSSISVSGSSEQKVPSVRKGGRGGGGNRNSGGGPGHSGHSVLSSVSSSSILHLSVLKTTRKINARLILLTELLIGTRGRERERIFISSLNAPPRNLFSPFLLLPPHARNSLPTRVAVLPFLPPSLFFSAESFEPNQRGVPLPFPPSRTLETELLSFQLPPLKTPQNARHGKTIYAGNLVTWAVEPRSYASLEQFFHGEQSKREEKPRKGKERGRSWRINSLAKRGYRRGKTGSARTTQGGVKKEKREIPRLTEKVGGQGLN